MEIEEIHIDIEEISKELGHLKTAIEEGYISKQSNLAKDLMAIYDHVKSYGGRIIDIPDTFSKAGLNDQGHPKIAMVQFKAKQCFLYKRRDGGAILSSSSRTPDRSWNEVRPKKNLGDIVLPGNTFEWPDLKDRHWKTNAPHVPPRILALPSINLAPDQYHVLFEADEWVKAKPTRPPGDPIIGRMLTNRLYGIIAHWKLSDLEKLIIQGRL